MPLCVFDESNPMFGVTPVENLFLEEFMPRAPGDSVKVYLYGLKLCQNPGKEMTLSAVARALAMEEERVESAFVYWERKGLLRRLSDRPVSYAYVNLQKALLEGKLHGGDAALPYQDFNNALQDLFGDRLLHAEDYQRVYALMEDLELPQDVVLLLVEHLIKTSARKQKLTMNQLEKEARLWAKEGCTTKEAALDYLRTKTADYDGARQVVKQLGPRRPPSLDEEALYRKWTEEWGFSLEEVLRACAETTKIANPNFAYVDAVLKKRRGQNLRTPQQLEENERQRAGLREVLASLGAASATVTEELLGLYAGWQAQGFDQEALVLAAGYLQWQGRGTPQELETLLVAWQAEGLTQGRQVREHLDRSKAQNQALQALFRTAGIRRSPTREDRAQLKAWQDRGAGMELLLLAAEYARHADNPFAMMNGILSQWLAKDVRDADAARREHEARQAAGREQGGRSGVKPASGVAGAAGTAGGPGGWNDYPQRRYSKEELEALYDDLDELLAQQREDEPR